MRAFPNNETENALDITVLTTNTRLEKTAFEVKKIPLLVHKEFKSRLFGVMWNIVVSSGTDGSGCIMKSTYTT